MARYYMDNGILRQVNGVYKCKPSYKVEIWDTIKERRPAPSGVANTLNIDGTKTILSLWCSNSADNVNRHVFNMYIDGTYVANIDAYHSYTSQYEISSVSGKQHPSLGANGPNVTYEFYPKYTIVNGVQKNGYLSQIRLRQYWPSSIYFMYYRRIFREGAYDFVPCKLIEDIPAEFAYNNKDHYADEVGWWNRTNNKFYKSSDGSAVVNGLVETLTIF